MEELVRLKADLLDLYVSCESIQDFLARSSLLLDNPLVLLDPSYKIIAHSDKGQISDPFWQTYVNKGFCSFEYILKAKQAENISAGQENPYFFPCHVCRDTKLVMTLKKNKSTIGYLMMLDSQHPLTMQDKLLVEILGKMITDQLSLKDFTRLTASGNERIFLDLLSGAILSTEELKDRAKSRGLPEAQAWRVLVCDASQPAALAAGNLTSWPEIKNQLQSTLHLQFCAYYENALVMLYTESAFQQFRERLMELAEKQAFVVGVSASFPDLIFTRDAYREAMECIRLSHFVIPRKSLIEHYEVNLYALLPDLPLELAFRRYAHPVLNRLLEYDLENDADLFSTLYTYLLQHENVNQTSVCLSLHRNTVRYKLRRASEIGAFSLENAILMVQLLLSYRILAYYVLKEYGENSKPAEKSILQIARTTFLQNIAEKCASCTLESCDFRQ